MPRRTQEFRGFSGFDAPAQNPFMRMPDGRRMLMSDINDAGMSLDFGGDSGGTRGAPLATEGVPSRGLAGPTVQTPTSDAQYTVDLDTAPSLFPSQNEWWRDGALAQGASTSNEGGSIWEGSESISDFGNDLALGSDLNTSLDSLQFGEDYPAIEAPFDPLMADTGIPVEPDVLDQEYEWTTSPEDRRFLAGPPEEETPQDVAGAIGAGGTSMSGFGGDLSLGNYLNTPLALMNFGGGYPQVSGGLADTSGREATATGAIQIDPTTGQPYDLESIPTATGSSTYTAGDGLVSGTPGSSGNTSAPSDMRIIGHDTRNGQPIYEDAQGNRFVNPGTGIPISAGVSAAIARGDYSQAYGTTAQQAANAKQMADAAANPTMNMRFITPQSDRGRTMFNTSGRRNIDRPTNISLEGDVIVRHPGGRTLGRGNTVAQVGGLG